MSDTHTARVVGIERPAVARLDPHRMHPMVAAATERGMPTDPATLRELMALQREWEAGEAKKAYTRALANLKRDLPAVIARDKEVRFKATYYTHTSLAAAMEVITGPLTAHGFALNWVPSVQNGQVVVTCRLTHAEGHHEEASLVAPPDNSGSKNPAQAVASTVTLLERYTALSLLGIATADMVDPQPAALLSDHVDPAKNMRAMRALADAGISREAAEAHVDQRVSKWTRGDLDRLRELLTETRAKAVAAPAEGEVTDEEEAAMERDLAQKEEG